MTSLNKVLIWYTFVVVFFLLWALCLLLFILINNRSIWLSAQLFLLLAFVFSYMFEKKRIQFMKSYKDENNLCQLVQNTNLLE